MLFFIFSLKFINDLFSIIFAFNDCIDIDFFNKLILNPFNYYQLRSSHRNIQQCKNFLNNIKYNKTDNSLLRSLESLRLIKRILI